MYYCLICSFRHSYCNYCIVLMLHFMCLSVVNVSTHLFDSLVPPILTYNCEIWNMDVYKPYFNATERAKKNNFNVDQMQFIEKNSLRQDT